MYPAGLSKASVTYDFWILMNRLHGSRYTRQLQRVTDGK